MNDPNIFSKHFHTALYIAQGIQKIECRSYFFLLHDMESEKLSLNPSQYFYFRETEGLQLFKDMLFWKVPVQNAL